LLAALNGYLKKENSEFVLPKDGRFRNVWCSES